MKRLFSLVLVLACILAVFSIPASASTDDPETFQATADSFIRQGWKNTNYGDEAIISVNVTNKDSGLVYFDLTDIPADAIITSATLQMTAAQKFGSGNTGTISVHRLLKAWDEDSVTFSNIGSYATKTAEASIPAGAPVGTEVEWDVTGDVSAFVNDGVDNNGWILTIAWVNNGTFSFYSKEADNDFAPKLLVNYTVPMTEPTAGTVYGELTDDVYTLQSGNKVCNTDIIQIGRAGDTRKGYVKFDLPVIPAGATITKATLQLNVKDLSGSQITASYAQKVTVDWDETVTYSAINGNVDSTVSHGNAPSQGGVVEIDVTADVAAFLTGTSNYGWYLSMTGTNERCDFYSKDSDYPELAPKLIIEYTIS